MEAGEARGSGGPRPHSTADAARGGWLRGIGRWWRRRRGACDPLVEPPRDGQPGGTWERFSYEGAAGRRGYAVYTPPNLGVGGPVPVVVVLHGCAQTAEDVAAGTRLNALADRAGFLVVYPEQSTRANRRGCWNWFEPRHQVRGSGEPSLIAGITEEVLADRRGTARDRRRVYVLGLSAGGAMASIVAATYPDLYAAVGVHSGLQYAAAQHPLSARAAMRGVGPSPERQGQLAHAAMGPRARRVPAVIVQGDQDATVHPSCGEQVVRQWLTTARLASPGEAPTDFAQPDAIRSGRSRGGLTYTVRSWNDATGGPLVEYWLVAGLGHAWSGGALEGSYADPRGPSATEVMIRFFFRHRLDATPRPAFLP